MSKGTLAKVVNDLRVAVDKHSPEILTGLGIAGMVTTTVLAVQATPKALALMEQQKDELGVDKLHPVEVAKTTWKCYVPAAAVGVVSVACLVGASSVNLRRNAALATAYALSESTLREYQKKVVEEIGEKKEKRVREAVTKDEVDRNPVSNNQVIITGSGDALCYDLACKRYFKSNIDKLRKVENELNMRLRNENYISLNEFYSEIGLDEVGVGHDLGWNIDKGYLKLEFSSHLTEDGTPCLVVGFDNPPRWDFRW